MKIYMMWDSENDPTVPPKVYRTLEKAKEAVKELDPEVYEWSGSQTDFYNDDNKPDNLWIGTYKNDPGGSGCPFWIGMSELKS